MVQLLSLSWIILSEREAYETQGVDATKWTQELEMSWKPSPRSYTEFQSQGEEATVVVQSAMQAEGATVVMKSAVQGEAI